MKSSQADLEKRGFINEADINNYLHLSYNELLKLIKSPSATERTIAVKLLRNYLDSSEEVIDALLLTLIAEKSLYTKIEICKALENASAIMAKKVISYLGRIGCNQHLFLPKNISKKNSYPLPRDIMARTLGKMSIDILPTMLEILEQSDTKIIREVIDAIGYMCFYNTIPNRGFEAKKLLTCLDTYNEDDVIRWKIVMSLSSFQEQNVTDRLEVISQTDDKELIRNEAKRSLALNNNGRGRRPVGSGFVGRATTHNNVFMQRAR